LRARKAEFEKAGARVVLVGMGTPTECTAFLRKLDVPFPMIADPQQTLYRRFNLKRMSALGVFSPTTVLRGVAAMVRGSGIGKPTGDILQLPGVFIIDRNGRIVFKNRPTGPADPADADTLLSVLAGAANGSFLNHSS
jgi:peroxiredoxin